MKKLVAMFILLSCVYAAQAQTNDNDTVPPYKKTTKIPEFAILKPDSTWFTNKQLPANKPLVIIYFSPDCGHCQMTAQEFVKDMDKLKNVELVWVSFHTPQQIEEFAEAYKLKQFSNVVLGRDPNYKIPVFYKIQFTPFMAVYDKKGTFLNAYPQGTSAETIAKLIKNGK
jgi:cytochrome oxidase Cu insertion factor (SCO1/SenC/PrrC family)